MSYGKSVSPDYNWIVLVRCSGHLDSWIKDYWHPLHIHHDQAGCTWLEMELPDSAAFYGMINQCRDLGLEIVSLNAYRKTDRE